MLEIVLNSYLLKLAELLHLVVKPVVNSLNESFTLPGSDLQCLCVTHFHMTEDPF